MYGASYYSTFAITIDTASHNRQHKRQLLCCHMETGQLYSKYQALINASRLEIHLVIACWKRFKKTFGKSVVVIHSINNMHSHQLHSDTRSWLVNSCWVQDCISLHFISCQFQDGDKCFILTLKSRLNVLSSFAMVTMVDLKFTKKIKNKTKK